MYGDTTMIRRFSRWSPTLAAVAAGLLFLSAPQGARATLYFEVVQPDFNFNNGSIIPVDPTVGTINSVVFIDQNFAAPHFQVGADGGTEVDLVLPDQNPVLGILSPSGSTNPVQVGNFLVTASTAQTSQSLGVASVTTTSTQVQNNDTVEHVQYIRVGNTGFTSPTGNVTWAYSFSASSITGAGSVANWAWDDPGNVILGGTASPFTTIGGDTDNLSATAILLVGGTPNSVYDQNTNSFPRFTGTTNVGAGPYSKTLEFDVTLSPGSILATRSNLLSNSATAVPEPGSMALAFSGLTLLGLFGWRRHGRKSAS